MSDPLISICVPTRNRAASLRESMKTISGQDYERLEILISDNASEDGTPEAVRDLMRADDRIRYVRHERNIGLRSEQLPQAPRQRRRQRHPPRPMLRFRLVLTALIQPLRNAQTPSAEVNVALAQRQRFRDPQTRPDKQLDDEPLPRRHLRE